jgi:hypothetical protein
VCCKRAMCDLLLMWEVAVDSESSGMGVVVRGYLEAVFAVLVS